MTATAHAAESAQAMRRPGQDGGQEEETHHQQCSPCSALGPRIAVPNCCIAACAVFRWCNVRLLLHLVKLAPAQIMQQPAVSDDLPCER